MKNVLIISSSPRKESNSGLLAASFAKGAGDAGHNVEVISLREKDYAFCKGCLACHATHKCVICDDAVEISQKMSKADVLVFASPVYYYSICGQLKTMLDRANPLYETDYTFTDVYFLAAAAEDEPETVAGSKTAIQGWVDCFPRASFKATVFAGGVTAPGEIQGHKALEEAYELGKNA